MTSFMSQLSFVLAGKMRAFSLERSSAVDNSDLSSVSVESAGEALLILT
jgi:hypothetical protein